jgi:hypothetical protein
MAPDLIMIIGFVVCGAAAAGAIASVIVLRFQKARLDKRLDSEYGKRRY